MGPLEPHTTTRAVVDLNRPAIAHLNSPDGHKEVSGGANKPGEIFVRNGGPRCSDLKPPKPTSLEGAKHVCPRF